MAASKFTMRVVKVQLSSLLQFLLSG